MKFSKFHKALTSAVLAGGVLVAIPAVQAQGIGLRTFERLLIPTEAKIERGQKIYQLNCVNCHGVKGTGETELAGSFDVPPPNFQAGEFRRSGGPISVYNVITKGTGAHPIYTNLAYQDRWAVTHYVRSLGPTDQYVDPPEVVAIAREEAEKGVCDDAVRSTIQSKVAFGGEAQLALGATAFAANCSSCHGAEGKGDGPAAAALKPPPRNFHSAEEKWTNGTSPLAIFNTITTGIAGTSMASFAHLSEEERWALTHLIREKWMPDSVKQESTEEQIIDVCRSLSGGADTAAIPIEAAMKFLAESQPERQALTYRTYGTSWVTEGANATLGGQVYARHCQACHGPEGAGATRLGPYGSQPPYLWLEMAPLQPASAGGTYAEFAKRSTGGAHISLPDMTGASHISEQEWQALHSYVASLPGTGEVRPAAQRPPQAPAATPGTTPGTAPAADPSAAPTEAPATTPPAPENQPAEAPAAAE